MTRPGPVHWARNDRAVCETYGLTPRQCDDLTLAEYAVLCMPCDDKAPPSGRAMSEAEAIAAARRFAALPPERKLEEAGRRRHA